MGDHYSRIEEKMDDEKRKAVDRTNLYVESELRRIRSQCHSMARMNIDCERFESLHECDKHNNPYVIWKMNLFKHLLPYKEVQPFWVIGTYDDVTKKTRWYRPVVRVKAERVICHDRLSQADFLFHQRYLMSGMNPWLHSTSEARIECKRRGYRIPEIRELY